MANEIFFIDFKSDDTGIKYIDEPVNFNTISFDLNQKEKGYGRDVFFNGGDIQLEFNKFRNHELDTLLYYFHYFGFEAKAQLGIEFTTGQTVLLDLDFKSAVTDDLEHFKCKCIEVSDVKIVDRRSSVKVNLFAENDVDNNSIAPVVSNGVIIKPKSIIATSKNETISFEDVRTQTRGTKYGYFFPFGNMVKTDLRDNYTFLTNAFFAQNVSKIQYELSQNPIFKAADTVRNITINIEYFLKVVINSYDSGDGYCDVSLIVKYGSDFNTATVLKPYITGVINDEVGTFTTTQNHSLNIPFLNREDKIWVYFENKLRESSSGAAIGAIENWVTINNGFVEITGESVSYHGALRGVRLIDAMKQVVKSISGNNVDAPRYDVGGEFYDTMIFNGNLLRNKDGQFDVSLDDISESLREHNADYETQTEVFFGIESDFYKPTECWFFDNTQFHSFRKKVNERFAINEFYFKYRQFKAQKENEAENTVDTIHGEAKMTLHNKMVENKKEVSVEWIRDSFLIEEAKKKAEEITSTTATQNDDTIFAIDVVENTEDLTITERDILYHEYWEKDGDKGVYLRSKESPNWISLGLTSGYFTIKAPDKNTGYYSFTNEDVKANELKLTAVPFPDYPNIKAFPNANNNGERTTDFKYTLSYIDYPFINRTNQGFTNISGINGSSGYSNMAYSVRRNIENYYSEYLSTCNLYWKDKPLSVTWYKNNRLATFTYDGKTTKEGSRYFPNNPILDIWMYEDVIFANVDLEDFFTIKTALQTDRGFIRCIDKTGTVIKLYPKKMSYENISKQLTIMGEAKYEPSNMTIVRESGKPILINGETSLMTLDWEIIDHKVYLYDSERQRLYNGVFWDKVSINGGFADSEEELAELLNLL